jgi:hypothetical protein
LFYSYLHIELLGLDELDAGLGAAGLGLKLGLELDAEADDGLSSFYPDDWSGPLMWSIYNFCSLFISFKREEKSERNRKSEARVSRLFEIGHRLRLRASYL